MQRRVLEVLKRDIFLFLHFGLQANGGWGAIAPPAPPGYATDCSQYFLTPKFENQINNSILGYYKTHSKAYLLSNGCFETGAFSSIERGNITELHYSVISSYLRYYVQLFI